MCVLSDVFIPSAEKNKDTMYTESDSVYTGVKCDVMTSRVGVKGHIQYKSRGQCLFDYKAALGSILIV